MGLAEGSVALRNRHLHLPEEVAPEPEPLEAGDEREQPFLRDAPPRERDFDLWESDPDQTELRVIPVLPVLRGPASMKVDSAGVSARSEVGDRTKNQAIDLGSRQDPRQEIHLVFVDESPANQIPTSSSRGTRRRNECSSG
jgi:hypothetical protein